MNKKEHLTPPTANGEKMRKVFKMQDLDCANCAAKMETAIKNIDGVNDASINFMTQKLTLDAEDACFEEILDKAAKACKKIESDAEIIR